MATTHTLWQQKLVNCFGGIGYIIGALEWLWAVALYMPFLQSISQQLIPANTTPVTPVIATPPNPGLMALGIFITIIMVGVTLYVLLRIPLAVIRTSKDATHNLATRVAPVVIKHQHTKDTSKRRRIITERLIVVGKLLIVTLPLVFVGLARFVDTPLDITLSTFICASLGLVALCCFLIQFGLARLFHIPRRAIW
jgi:hypothetical protein